LKTGLLTRFQDGRMKGFALLAACLLEKAVI